MSFGDFMGTFTLMAHEDFCCATLLRDLCCTSVMGCCWVAQPKSEQQPAL